MPPRVPAGLVDRGDVARRLATTLDAGGLVTITAGAGYGKSLLLARAIAHLTLPWVFLSCDRHLDPAALVAHLAEAIDGRFPGFGANLATAPVNAMTDVLLNEMATAVPDDLVIVLDDVHDLPDRAREVVTTIVRQAPPHVTFALAGRTALTHGHPGQTRTVLALDQRDLALTFDEAVALVGSNVALDRDAIGDLYARTEGWPAALSLASQATTRHAAQIDQPLIDYLAGEVFDAQPPKLREFLITTSILDRFSPRVAAAVSGFGDADQMCRDLAARHLFTIRLDADGEWYRYHALLVQVLSARLESQPHDVAAQLHRRAATALLDEGEIIAAAHHFIAADDPRAAADALAPVASAMATSADAAALVDLLTQIPDDARGDPGLGVAHALALGAVGSQREALDKHEHEIERALGREDHAAMGELFVSRHAIRMLSAPALDPDPLLERILPALPEALPGLSLLHAQHALDRSFARDGRGSDEPIARARELARTPAQSLFADAMELQVAGRLRGSPRRTLVAINGIAAAFRDIRQPELLRVRPYVFAIRGSLLVWFGHFEEAIAALDEHDHALRDSLGWRSMMTVSVWSRLVALAGLGRWSEFATIFDRLDHLLGRNQGTVNRSYLRPLEAAFSLAQKNRAGLADTIEAFRDERSLFEGRRWELASLTADLANIAASGGMSGDATALALAAIDDARDVDSPWLTTRALLAASRSSPRADGDSHLARALELSKRHQLDDVWSRRDRRFATELLARAIVRGLGPDGHAAYLAARAGAEVFASLVPLVQSAPPEALRSLFEAGVNAPGVAREDLTALVSAPAGVRTRSAAAPGSGTDHPHVRLLSLGGFGLVRDGERLPNAAFGRPRARAVLAALLAANGPVHRDQLLEWFWPDLDPSRGTRAFHVTMSALRRVVEPGLERRDVPTIVVTEGQSYSVRLTESVTFDAVEFIDLVEAAVADDDRTTATGKLVAALSLHAGDPFPEWPYEPWVETLRDRVQRAHLRALETTGRYLLEAGDHDGAIDHLSNLVALDPCHETGHRHLMSTYAASGERARALRQFHACRSALVREQGVEPSQATRDLYADILGADSSR